MKRKLENPRVDQSKDWEKSATQFEDKNEFQKIINSSRILSASEKRRLLGPSKTKQISVRLPEEDLVAVKEIAEANSRPYQQLVVVAVQQFLDRVSERMPLKHGKKTKQIA